MFLQVKQFHDAKKVNTRFPSFVIPKITVFLTHETRIKDAVKMEDLICLLATVRTLNAAFLAVELVLPDGFDFGDFPLLSNSSSEMC